VEQDAYESLLSELVSPNGLVGSLSDPRPPIVPSGGVRPTLVSITGAAAGMADAPVRIVPVRAVLELVFEAAFRRLLVFLRPPERDAVFLRAPVERVAVFLRPVERDAVFLRAVVVFLRPVERVAVFFRAVVLRAVVLRAVERDAVFLRAPVERVRAAVVRLAVPPLERVLEVFLRALAIRAPPR
jgi:hypothetical protein